MTEDETAIRDVIELWAGAVRAGDIDEILARHTDDVVIFDVPMPPQSVGLDAYRKTWELFFQYNSGGPGSFDVDELTVTADETVAFCFGFVRIFDARVRITIGLRKQGGAWTIAHEHHSYPAGLPEEEAWKPS